MLFAVCVSSLFEHLIILMGNKIFWVPSWAILLQFFVFCIAGRYILCSFVIQLLFDRQLNPSNSILISIDLLSIVLLFFSGCVGGVCALANILGEEVCELQKLFSKGLHTEAKNLQHRLIAPNGGVSMLNKIHQNLVCGIIKQKYCLSMVV